MKIAIKCNGKITNAQIEEIKRKNEPKQAKQNALYERMKSNAVLFDSLSVVELLCG